MLCSSNPIVVHQGATTRTYHSTRLTDSFQSLYGFLNVGSSRSRRSTVLTHSGLWFEVSDSNGEERKERQEPMERNAEGGNQSNDWRQARVKTISSEFVTTLGWRTRKEPPVSIGQLDISIQPSSVITTFLFRRPLHYFLPL